MTMSSAQLDQVEQYLYQGDQASALVLLEAVVPKQGYVSQLKGIGLMLTDQKEHVTDYLQSPFQPETPEQYCNLAMSQLLLGLTSNALITIEKAIELGADHAVAYGRLGAIQLALGHLEAAQQAYQEAVNREAGRAEWHNNLGGSLLRQQKLEPALENFDIALQLKPELEQAQQARTRVLVALDRTDEVVQQLEVELAKDPTDFETRMRLAHALVQDNRHMEALSMIGKVLLPLEEVEKPEVLAEADEEKSTEQETWLQQINYRAFLANTFSAKSIHLRAQKALEQLLELEPKYPVPFIRQLSDVLVERGHFEQAETLLDQSEAEHPEANPIKQARASLYCETERYAEAEALQRDLMETYPGDANLKSQLGQTLLWRGKLDEAAELFKEASAINPMALVQMVNAKRMPEDEASLRKMEDIADNPLMADPGRINMGFALAEIYDKKKDFAKAFHYLALANQLTDKGLDYSVESFRRQVDVEKQVFTREFLESAPNIRTSDRTPIFIVGMPRSGTTLTEQILCSHPDIFGAGELDLMSRLTRLMPAVLKTKKLYPPCVSQMTPHLREEAARFYLNGIHKLDTEHSYVVDKMPHNFMHVGLMAMIFPSAKIIHIQRDPRDTALSNFQQNFKAKHGGLGYSFNQEKMAEQFNDYHRMMNHWREVLPDRMFELTYEEMVANQEGITRELLSFVGVEWDDSVKDFHKTDRAVRTASVSQVRQPIYQTSKQKWRNYESSLQPFLTGLNPEVTAKWDQTND